MKDRNVLTPFSTEKSKPGSDQTTLIPGVLEPERLRLKGERFPESTPVIWETLITWLFQVFEGNLGLQEKLLKTKGYLLLNREEERVLGGKWDDFKRVLYGQNLWGEALMIIRRSLGGEENPALSALRMSQMEIHGNWTWESMTSELIQEMASVFLGKVPKLTEGSKSSIKRMEAYTSKLEALVGFMERTGWQPLPRLEDTVFQTKAGFPRALLDWMFVIQAAETDARFKLSPQLESCFFWSNDLKAVLKNTKTWYLGHLLQELGVPSEQPMVPTPDQKGRIVIRDAGAFYAWYLGEQTALLSPEDKGELCSILLGENESYKIKVTGGKVTLEDEYMYSSHSMSVDMGQGWVTLSGEPKKAFPMVVFGHLPSRSDWLLIELVLMAGDMGTVRHMANQINLLPNLWQREANYGYQWETDHPTPLIKNGGYMPLSVESTRSETDLTGLNFFNKKFSGETLMACISLPAFRYGFFTDKTSMKMVSTAGKAALTSIAYSAEAEEAMNLLDLGFDPFWVYNEYFDTQEEIIAALQMIYFTKVDPRYPIQVHGGYFVSGLDGSKVTKLLNRAQQFSSFLEALVTVFLEEETYTRVQCGLRVICDPVVIDEEEVVIASEEEEDTFLS